MSDASTILALIEAQGRRSEERHREVVRRLDHLEAEVAELRQQVRNLLAHRVTDQQEIDVNARRLARHLDEHYGDPDAGKPPAVRTASAWTMANTYPGRTIGACLGLLALTIYEVRVWLYRHAEWVWKVWWKVQ